jgi:hypothetical protein
VELWQGERDYGGHPYTVDGERRPHGHGALLAVRRARERPVKQARACGARGPASAARPEMRVRPINQQKMIFLFLFQTNSPKHSFLSKKNSFLGHGPKTKVIQNFIPYNIALGYILKFQLDFEIGI